MTNGPEYEQGSSVWERLRRRKVVQWGLAYTAGAWALLQGIGFLADAFHWPDATKQVGAVGLAVGLPVVLVLAWYHGDRGQQRMSGAELAILSVLLALGGGALWLYGQRDAQVPAASSPPAAPTAATATGAGDADAASIAVLPFVNMSDDKTNEYFSDGLTEELLNTLANVPGLRVIARTSSFAYKDKDVKIADVARELDVSHVLEGSVRKSGNHVRITTQLIRASDSSHLWSQTYDRDLRDIFEVQDEISNEVVGALKIKLLQPVASASSGTGGTRVPAAYEAYLRGRQLRREAGPGSPALRGAIAAFDEAIRLDPQYAHAYAAKADAQVWLTGYYTAESFEPGFKAARESAERAVALAPDLPEALLALYAVQFFSDVNPGAAAESVERALRLSPGSLDVQITWSLFATHAGWPEYSVPAARRAVALDPLSPDAYQALAWALTYVGQLDEAERVARRLLAIAPSRPVSHWNLGLVLFLQGRNDEAMTAFDQETLPYLRMTGRALVFARLGKPDLARQEIAAMQQTASETASYQYAEIYAALGDRDQAFHWLANARKAHDPGLLESYSDPLLDPLRSDPRYRALMSELGFTRLKRPDIAAAR